METIKAHSKINLYLHITGKEEFGGIEYHSLDSLIFFSQLHDLLEIGFSKTNEDKLSIKGKFAYLISSDPKDNILIKTLDKIRNLIEVPALEITLYKEIPVMSGLGGGSADAASLIRWISSKNQMLSQVITEKFLLEIGADLPACVLSKTCLVTGIGSIDKTRDISSVSESLSNLYILLAKPEENLSTKEIFSNFTKEFKNKLEKIPHLSAMKNQTYNSLSGFLNSTNALEKFISSQEDCIIARMTGSGSACFGIFKYEAQANNALIKVKERFPQYWSCISRII